MDVVYLVVCVFNGGGWGGVVVVLIMGFFLKFWFSVDI